MTLTEQNQKRWDNCKVYDTRGPLFEKVANRIRANKEVYDRVEKATGVPWWFVGIAHYRESNLNLKTQLGQGDPLNQVSRHVPKGRGPFATFEDGAYDALVNCAPYAARNKDWSIGGALTMFEKYNGLGYYQRSMPSPYVWAGTNQYSRGKYVRDGVFDPNAVDSQLGCAGLMKYLGIGKKPPVMPLGIAAVSGGAASYTFWDTFTQHPWLYVGAALLAVAAVSYIYLKVKSKLTPAPEPLPEPVEDGSASLGKTDAED